jgi:hypothetical protein
LVACAPVPSAIDEAPDAEAPLPRAVLLLPLAVLATP